MPIKKSKKIRYSQIRFINKSKNKSKTQKRCMDVEGGYIGENGRIILYSCHNGPNQKLHYNRKTKRIQIKSSRKCIDLDNHGRLVQNTCSSSKKTQKWIKRKNKWISVANNKCIGLTKFRHTEKDPKTLGDLVTIPC